MLSCDGRPVDVVTVDGVHVLLHEVVTELLGDAWRDVAEVVDNTRVVVEEDVRHQTAAVRDVEVSVLRAVAGVEAALGRHLLQVGPALVTEP